MEQKFKQANAFSMLGEALASGITKITDLTVDAYDNVKVAFDTPEVKRMKVVASFAKMGVLGDVTQMTTIVRTMFPLECRGIKIDYGNPFYEKCPRHHTNTFRTSMPNKVWCPLCMDFLDINP